jgi:sugar lactone lactonase YvrE
MNVSASLIRLILPLCAALILGGCASTPPEEASPGPAALPQWTFFPEMIFPADRSLNRPEDGVILPDGRLVVSDQLAGLRVVEADGSSRPFGKMPEAGYLHNPPAVEAGANGVTMDPAGSFILVADMWQGGIYRVDVATEATRKIYQHEFGINMARADSRGGIWFSQSTRNRPEENSAGLWKSVDIPVADGALCYIAPGQVGKRGEAVVLADGFLFTNGLVLDEEAGMLYLAETMASRVWKFAADVASGTVGERELAFEISFPDNLELDAAGRIWVACPLRSELVVVDPKTGSMQSVFNLPVPGSGPVIAEIHSRLAAGEPWLELAGPQLWGAAPAFITGMVLDLDNGTVYATTLGDAVIRLTE